MIVGVPGALGAYDNEQLSLDAPAGDSVQVPPDPKLPAPEDENETDPPGRDGTPMSLSETVAVHVVEPETENVDGAQTTLVAVARVDTEIDSEPLLAAQPGSEPAPG